MYYFITDHIGNVRVVANATGGVVEESDYLPFGTENVITDTITNNYKFIGMERDFEGTAALDHTLYRQYAPNLARWTSPDPVHGSRNDPLDRFALNPGIASRLLPHCRGPEGSRRRSERDGGRHN